MAGTCASFCLTWFAVVVAPRNLRLKARAMVGSEHLLPSISLSTSNSIRSVDKKKSTRSISDSLAFNVEDDAGQAHLPKDQSFNDDPATLQAMTLQQLRAMSRNFGISVRGSKHDLVLALTSFLDNQKDGPSSSITGEHVSFEVKPIHLENTSSRGKDNNSSTGDHAQNLDIVSKVSRNEQIKRIRKLPPSDGTNVKANIKSVISKQKLPVKADEVPVHHERIPAKRRAKNSSGGDMEPSPAKRTGSSRTENEDGGSTDGVGSLGNPIEPWTVLAHKKPQQGWVPYNPRTMRRQLADGVGFVKLISWNVNGLRALMKSEGFSTLAKNENFDVLCLQETKLQEKDVEKIKQCLIDGYENSFWTCSVSKLGYSGTAIISRIKPLSVRYGLGILDHDTEGRLVTVEFDTFYLISGYVPNSGDGLKRLTYRVTQWDPSLGNYVKELEKSKPVILTGDLNCAHQEIDIFNPAGNRRSAGFTDEERASFETNFLSKGFIDTFRRQHPGVVGYTYWGYRHGGRIANKGWRLDYFLVSESMADKVHDSYILPDIMGSDHCPIGLILKL